MRKAVLLCVFSAALGALAVIAVNPPWRRPAGAQDGFQFAATEVRGAVPAADVSQLTPDELINVRVYENTNRSVVNISTRGVRTDFFFEAPREGAGSGSVLDKKGHILTNFHVVEDAREIMVTLFDGNSYEARLVGTDPNSDIAVIKIEAPGDSLHPLSMGDSSRLLVGQKVFAIGNPFGLERTFSTGVVSSLNRSMKSRNGRLIRSIIQLDADINPGNSGGPLLDTQGRMIGMNTAIASSTGQSAGVGFAVPSSTIVRIVPQLVEHGRVIRGDAGIAKAMTAEQGVLLAVLAQGGPAEKAGLRGFRVVRETKRRGVYVWEQQRIDRSEADLVVAVDGQPVKNYEDLLTAVESHKPGEEVVFTVDRDGQKVDVRVRLAESGE